MSTTNFASSGVTSPFFGPTGLTGATAASRYVGATASGAPTTGTFAVGDYVISQDGKLWICTAAGTPGTWVESGGGGGGSGTVTSVALTAPTEFSVAGSPVTTSGTLAITKAAQNANKVWAGPATGADAAPTFRALVAADIPATPIALADNHVLVGNGSGVATDVAMTGAITIDNTGFTTLGTAVVKAINLASALALLVPYNVIKSTAAGGAASQTFTLTGCVATDVVQIQVESSANPVQVQKIVPGVDNFEVFFTTDPGAVTLAIAAWHTV